jgi:predicted metal-dependent peptidase
MTKMQKARARLLIKSPFFASLVLSLPLVEKASIPTAATDMQKIYYNPAFIESLDIDVIIFVLAHEAGHVMFKHGLRRQARNPQRWNQACDQAINIFLKEAGFTIWEHCLCDYQYQGMSAEQIYDAMPESSWGGGLDGDVMEPGNLGPETRAVIERTITQKVAQAASIARIAGKLSDNLARFVDGILNPVVPWPELLREYMTRVVMDDESWSHRTRRFRDVFLPSRHGERMGEIIMIGDTSGSITSAELAKVAAEVSSIADTIQPEKIRLVWADDAVSSEQEFEPSEPIEIKPTGGGGTDMRVPLEYVTRYEPEVVILVTDGLTPWPDVEPEYPLIVLCTTETAVPVGQVIGI